MLKYTLRRLLQAIPTFFGITLISYFLVWAAPGDPVARLFFGPNIRPEAKERLSAQLGLNDPVHIQYLRWLLGDDWMRRDTDGDGIADTSIILPLDADGDGEPEPPGQNKGILRGDFGNSFLKRRPAWGFVAQHIPATLELGLSALLVSLLVGVPVGVLSAVGRGGVFDNSSRVMAVILNAVPGFWLGLMLILIFGSQLGVLPMGSQCEVTLTGTCPPIYQRIKFLLLPTITLAAANIAIFSRYTRAAMLEILEQDYVRTARAKGLTSQYVYFKHALRNALIPVATLLGQTIPILIGGAVVTETIFSWPGVGRVGVDAVIQQDFPVTMTVVILTSIATILGFLLSDLLYAVIDPRVRLDGSGGG
ncbi:MAG: ABC transporter permease [Chloroflexi bacterium]|nr:MAG: diguanylate cyclase [Phototrophicales bacterium]RMF82843.1 MAG: ABC transporter permease [Chloroflexota bacterium]